MTDNTHWGGPLFVTDATVSRALETFEGYAQAGCAFTDAMRLALEVALSPIAPPSSWRISGDGYGPEPALWDCGDTHPDAWRILARHDRLPAEVWDWLTRVVPPLEPEREGDPDVVTARADLRSDHA